MSVSSQDIESGTTTCSGSAAVKGGTAEGAYSRLDPTLCRHFALRGTCKFEDNCHYSHVLPDDCVDWNEACQKIPCPHFHRGICRYRSMCRLAHCNEEDGEENADAGSGRPTSSHISMPFKRVKTTENSKDRPEEESLIVSCENSYNVTKQTEGNAAATTEEMICGICFEPLGQMRNNSGDIKHNRKKFGLLEACPHVFCIQCLRTWRLQQKRQPSHDQDQDYTSNRVRACPTCRQPSDFVVPSDRFCVGEEKVLVVAEYKSRLSCTPCKRFNGKLGSCPFGKDCFYAHCDTRTGKDMKDTDKSREELWKERSEKQRRKQRRRRVQRLNRLLRMNLNLELVPIEFVDDDSEDDDFFDFAEYPHLLWYI